MLPVLLALLFITIIFIVVIAGRPDEFCVTRTATIPAPAEKVFAQVNELRAWEAWSPWARRDPNAKSIYSGPASGVGAAMSWDGNRKVGAGRMTIVESRPNQIIRIKLEFLRPFKATNMAEFIFQPRDNQTIASWSMVGVNNFASKIFSLFVNCENMVGKDFDNGIANLKSAIASK